MMGLLVEKEKVTGLMSSGTVHNSMVDKKALTDFMSSMVVIDGLTG